MSSGIADKAKGRLKEAAGALTNDDKLRAVLDAPREFRECGHVKCPSWEHGHVPGEWWVFAVILLVLWWRLLRQELSGEAKTAQTSALHRSWRLPARLGTSPRSAMRTS